MDSKWRKRVMLMRNVILTLPASSLWSLSSFPFFSYMRVYVYVWIEQLFLVVEFVYEKWLAAAVEENSEMRRIIRVGEPLPVW